MKDFDTLVQDEANRLAKLMFDVESLADLNFDSLTQGILYAQAAQNVCERQIQ